MKLTKIFILFISLVSMMTLFACSGNEEEPNTDQPPNTGLETDTKEQTDTESDSHAGMEHSSSGEIPEGLKVAENPTYEVGSHAILETDHMEGMKGAEATIVGAYDTTAYVVSYTPTTGGERVENHKWVIREEIENSDKDQLEPGSEVVLKADHMKGMDGATAVIESAEETIVYMVDYTPTTGGEEVKNHKWVTESELSAE